MPIQGGTLREDGPEVAHAEVGEVMTEWLTRYAEALSGKLLRPDREMEVSGEVAERLLALARSIAERTGEKTNAPLSSYLVGRFAVVRALEGVPPAEAVAEAKELAETLLSGAPEAEQPGRLQT